MNLSRLPWRTIQAVGLVLLLALLVHLAGQAYPKYASRFVLLGVFFLLDLLYRTFQVHGLSAGRHSWRKMAEFWFWAPYALLLLYAAISWLWPISSWPAGLQVYFTALLFLLIIWKATVLLILVLGDLILLLPNVIGHVRSRLKREGIFWRRFRPMVWIAAGLANAVLILLLSGFVWWVYDFRVVNIEIVDKQVPQAFDGFVITQLSDIHLGTWVGTSQFSKAVDKVLQTHPDLLIFTGDLVNYSTAEAMPFKKEMRRLRAPWGVYGILGNHDYGDYRSWPNEQAKMRNMQDLITLYESVGWKLLRNQHVWLVKGNDSLALAGVENWSSQKLWGQRGDLDQAIAGVNAGIGVILLSHDPTHWRKKVLHSYRRVFLTLSGHTHAMQMGWETAHSQWSPAEWIFPEWGGLYADSFSGVKLYVNRGLGSLGLPMRIGIRPEITRIVLKRAI